MNWPLVRKIVRIVGSFVGLCIFLFLVYDGLKKLMGISTTLEFSWSYVALTFVLNMLIYFFQIFNFKIIYTSLHQNVNLLTTIIGYSFSFLPKYIPGYVWGYYSRSDWFKEKAEIPSGYSWQASLVEVLITVFTSSSIWLAYYFSKTTENIWAYMILITPFLAIIPINKLLKIFKIHSKTEKLLKNVEHVPYNYWLIITMNSYFQWILFGMSLWAVNRIFFQTSLVNLRELLDLTYTFARSWLSGFLAILIPNGLGVREIVLNELLVDVNAVSKNLSTIISTSSRLLMLIAEFSWLIVAIFLNRKPKNQRYIESIIE